MCLVSVKQPYVLQIMYDEYAESPRSENDSFGKMICWHNRYNLGDEHDYSEPKEFLKQLVTDSIPSKDIVQYVKDGKAKDVKLEYDNALKEWSVTSYYPQFSEWYTEYSFKGKLKDGFDMLADVIIDEMYTKDLLERKR